MPDIFNHSGMMIPCAGAFVKYLWAKTYRLKCVPRPSSRADAMGPSVTFSDQLPPTFMLIAGQIARSPQEVQLVLCLCIWISAKQQLAPHELDSQEHPRLRQDNQVNPAGIEQILEFR